MRYTLATAMLAISVNAASAFEELNEGWWIVAGSFRQSGVDRNDPSIRKASEALKRCGFRPFNDFSIKFSGFSPGYDIVVTGPYSFEAEAKAVLASVKKCVPVAYIKNGQYLGE